MIKHNSSISVLSHYNPVTSLKPNMRKLVNELFISPIVHNFFSDMGGIANFCELDPDKLKTEVEFEQTENYIKTYIYKEIIDEIEKQGKVVLFKPKYVITFDKDLTNYQEKKNIKYGVIRLGNQPILYYIYIDLQELIRFIKTQPTEITEIIDEVKTIETEEEKRNKLVDLVILNKNKFLEATEHPQERGLIKKEIENLKKIKLQELEGLSGKLRINLSWNTTDDLDLHVVTPNGEIAYNTPNRIIEYNGVLGELDLDQNAGNDVVSNPQENVNFNAMPYGLHKIYVHFFTQREKEYVPFTLTIIQENGEGRIFSKSVKGKGDKVEIATFEYKDGELSFIELT